MKIKHLSLISFFSISLFSSYTAHAQTIQNFSGWGAVFSSTKISKKLSIHFDGQLRSNDKWEQFQTIILRPGLNYKVNDNQVATIGYAFVHQFRTLGSASDWEPEHRVWEQYIFNQKFSIGAHPSSLQHRLRLEQRFLPKIYATNNELSTDGYNFSQRLRYFTRGIFPLQASVKFDKGMFVSLQDEIMFNIVGASNVNDKFFDQNRAYVSLGYRLSAKMDIETGFMNQYVAGRNDIRVVNNILQFAVYLRL